LLVGLGNPIMGDDGVGINVVRLIKSKVQSQDGIEFKELSLGGLRLVEELLGFEEAIIVDSVSSDEAVGKISEVTPEQLKNSRYSSSPHAMNFATALELYKKLKPESIPTRIRIFTIAINSEYTFNDRLSPQVEEAAQRLANLVVDEIAPRLAS
jgi:hydrogenase maturation protease